MPHLCQFELPPGAVPAAFTLAAIAVMAPYKLTEAKFREIVVDIAQRRAARRTDGTQ